MQHYKGKQLMNQCRAIEIDLDEERHNLRHIGILLMRGAIRRTTMPCIRVAPQLSNPSLPDVVCIYRFHRKAFVEAREAAEDIIASRIVVRATFVVWKIVLQRC